MMALEKGGPGARKVRGGHYLVCQKKVAEAVLVYESKVVTKKRSLLFQFFSKIMVSSKKKRSSLPIHLPLPKFFPKIVVFSKKKGLHFQFISPFPNFSPKSWCSLKRKKSSVVCDVRSPPIVVVYSVYLSSIREVTEAFLKKFFFLLF